MQVEDLLTFLCPISLFHVQAVFLPVMIGNAVWQWERLGAQTVYILGFTIHLHSQQQSPTYRMYQNFSSSIYCFVIRFSCLYLRMCTK